MLSDEVEFALEDLAVTVDGNNVSSVKTMAVKAKTNIDGEDVALGTLVKDNVESVILGRPGEGTTLNLSALGATDFNRVEEIR